MRRLTALSTLMLLPFAAGAASLSLSAASIEGQGLRLEAVNLQLAPQALMQLTAKKLQSQGLALLSDLRLQCQSLQVHKARAECQRGQLKAGSALGLVEADFSLSAEQGRSALFDLKATLSGQKLVAKATLTAEQFTLQASSQSWQAAKLLGLPLLKGKLPVGAKATGAVDFALKLVADSSNQSLNLQLASPALTASEESGRFATEKLQLALDLSAKRPAVWFVAPAAAKADTRMQLELQSGQAYAEPIFLDFGAAQMQARANGSLVAKALKIERFTVEQKGLFVGGGTAELALQPLALRELQAELANAELPAFYTSFIAPMLAGKPGEDTETTGQVSASITVHKGQPQYASLSLKNASAEAKRFDSGLTGLNGKLVWTSLGQPAQASNLSWGGGHLGKLDLPGASVSAQASGDSVTLLKPLRQGILDGALRIDAMRLTQLSSKKPQAELSAEIEPIDLKALTAALGLPQFSGRLAGRLPGLTYADNVVALQGALTAQAFDGNITIDNFRWIEPTARSQRLNVDIALRRIELAQLTGAFSFGRIDGRIDGDVVGLKLLGLKPVAFDARIYTSPKDPGKRRISQRAIDNISSIGGGPSGVLSRSALRVFEDFAYQKLGLSCRLRNGVCEMGGVEPAKDGGYVLVKGSLLPRIDVVGHTRRVDWDTFYAQLQGLRDLQAPTVGGEAPPKP